MSLKFKKTGIDRWTCGPYVIAKYTDGFFAFRYFKYQRGGRDSKRLHKEKEAPQSFVEAKMLCERTNLEPIPKDIRLINAPC